MDKIYVIRYTYYYDDYNYLSSFAYLNKEEAEEITIKMKKIFRY
jgi:hypothetical protein